MRFQPLSDCCFFFNLRTAGNILGVLGIFISVFRLYRVFRIADLLFGDSDVLIGVLAAIFTVVIIVANICWLYGLKKDKPNFMLPTVVLDAIGIICTLLCALVVLIFSKEIEENAIEKSYPVYSAVAHLLIALPEDYFWIVEYSVYQFIKEDKDQDKLVAQNVTPKTEDQSTRF